MTIELVVYTLMPALWLAWLLYWWLSACNLKPTRSRESLAAELRGGRRTPRARHPERSEGGLIWRTAPSLRPG